MNSKNFFSALFLIFFIFSCGSNGESSGEEQKLSATVNGEEWFFYNLDAERSAQDLEITGQGYLRGDRDTAPMDLKMTVTGLAAEGEISTPFEAYFSPNTTGNAALATIIPVDRTIVFDTKTGPATQGTFVINEAENGTISGEFSFVATDKGGRSLEVNNGKFNDISY